MLKTSASVISCWVGLSWVNVRNLGWSADGMALCYICCCIFVECLYCQTHKHTHTFNGLFSRTTWVLAGTRKVNHSGFYWSKRRQSVSGISWTICQSFAPHSRQITMPVPHHSIFYGPNALPGAQPTVSKHWRQPVLSDNYIIFILRLLVLCALV